MAQLVENLLCKYKVLSSNPSLTKQISVNSFFTTFRWWSNSSDRVPAYQA
jgi:hypothetical protein